MGEPRIIVHRLSNEEPPRNQQASRWPVPAFSDEKVEPPTPKKRGKKNTLPRVSLDEIVAKHEEAIGDAESDAMEILTHIRDDGPRTHLQLQQDFQWPPKRVTQANIILTRRGYARIAGHELTFLSDTPTREVTATRSKTTTTTVREEESVSIVEPVNAAPPVPLEMECSTLDPIEQKPPEPEVAAPIEPIVEQKTLAAPPRPQDAILEALYKKKLELEDEIAAVEVIADIASGSSRLIFMLNDYADFCKGALDCMDDGADAEQVQENMDKACAFAQFLDGGSEAGQIFKKAAKHLLTFASYSADAYAGDDMSQEAIDCRAEVEECHKIAAIFGMTGRGC